MYRHVVFVLMYKCFVCGCLIIHPENIQNVLAIVQGTDKRDDIT